MNRLALVCPMYPSVNRWPSHWMGRYLAKKQYEESVLWRVKIALAGRKPPNWKQARVTVTLRFKTNRRRDLENYSGAKWLIDALVRGNVIEDDSAKNLQLRVVDGDRVEGTEYVEVMVERG